MVRGLTYDPTAGPGLGRSLALPREETAESPPAETRPALSREAGEGEDGARGLVLPDRPAPPGRTRPLL